LRSWLLRPQVRAWEVTNVVFEKLTSKFFGLDDEGWMRHANPWSGWMRVPCLVLLVAAFWSRVWLGWYSAIPIAAILLWTYFSPRIFPKPKSTQNWASKAVLGSNAPSNHVHLQRRQRDGKAAFAKFSH